MCSNIQYSACCALSSAQRPFDDIVYEICRLYIAQQEVSDAELSKLVRASFNDRVFAHKDLVPLVRIGEVSECVWRIFRIN